MFLFLRINILFILFDVTKIGYKHPMYLQPIVTQYLVCNKSEIWP